MEDNTTGKIIFIGLVALVIWGVSAFITAEGEAARRARLIIGSAIGLGVAAIWFLMVGPIGFAITAMVIGAGFWIAHGNNK